MSGPKLTHYEVSGLNLPPIQPRTLARTLGELLDSEPEILWAAILILCQGHALGIKAEPAKEIHLLWAASDSGYRETVSSHLASQISEQLQQPEPIISRLDAPGPKVCISLSLPGRQLVCALVVDEDSAQVLSQRISLFQASVGYFLAGSLQRKQQHLTALVSHSSAWVELSTQFLSEPYFESACLRLSEHLQRHLQVQGVAVGSSTSGKKAKLHALTGLAEVDTRGRIAELMHTLFASAHDHKDLQKVSLGVVAETPVLKEVCKQLQVPDATLLPLGSADDSRRFHLLVLGKSEETAFIQALSQPLSALLTSQYKTRPRGPRKWISQLVGDKTPWKKALFWFLTLFALIFLLQPVPSRLRVEGQLEPMQRRMISAKGSGLLIKSSVRPGDVVTEGQMLARLDDRELRLREAELMATRERRLKRRDALAGSAQVEVAERQIAALELEETEKQLALIRFQRDQLQIPAPIDGVLLAGDLSRRLGSSVEKGDLLFELAPLDSMNAELKVPSRSMSKIKMGMPVRLRLEPYPEREWEGTLLHIHGRSQSTDPENPFLIQVPLPDHGDLQLRPGMQVRAVILGEKRPRILHLLQPWVDQARIFFFR